MRMLAYILGIVAIGQVSPLRAQLAPGNELGLSLGHMHIYPGDRDKEMKALLALGGKLGNNLSNNIPIGFPGIVILIGDARPGDLGSAGSAIDHVSFKVQDLQASLTKWKGVNTWWLPERANANKGVDGNWGLKIEPGTRPGHAFVTTPGGIRIEILEDKALKAPIVFDHVHYLAEESRLKAMEDFYTTMFGAKPVKGETDTLSIPGGKLVFSKSAKAPIPTLGRTLDHVGFNMLNAEVLAAFAKTLEAKGVKYLRPFAPASMGMIRVASDFGTNIEITKAQGGYFDTKLLDTGFYQVDEGGRKEGETPSRRR